MAFRAVRTEPARSQPIGEERAVLNRIIHLLGQSSLILDMACMDTPKQWEQLRTPYLYN